eukprot:s44_g11.t2
MLAGGIYALILCVTLSGDHPDDYRNVLPGIGVFSSLPPFPSPPLPSPPLLSSPDSRHTFVINAAYFQDLGLWQEWTLRAGSGCEGPSVGIAILTPEIDAADPTNNSSVTITINDTLDAGDTLSVCASSHAGRCVAELRLPAGRKMLVDLFSGVLNSKTLRAFHSMQPSLAALFEVLLAAALIVVVFTVIWFVYLAHSALKAEQAWGLTETQDLSDRHLRLPKPSDIISQGLIDVLFFVIGCGLFALEGERLFRTYHDPSGVGYILVLCFPLLFGCFAVLRIFLATARCHLYYESLRNGLLLKFHVSSSRFDPLVLWFWLGIIITTGAALKVVWYEQSTFLMDVQALVVFASPIYYMTSSIMDIQHAENTALKSECILGLEGISKDEPVTVGAKNNIVPVHESVFVCLARSKQPVNATSSSTSEEDASTEHLSVSDLRWVAGVSRRTATGVNRFFLLLFDPTLVCTLLCLAMLSCTVCFRKITTKPEMLKLEVIGGMLATGFSPHMQDYSVFLERGRGIVAIQGQVDAKETARFSVIADGVAEANTTGAVLTQPFMVDRQERYPVLRSFVVADATTSNDYRIQMLHTGILPSSVTLVAETTTGQTFRRCVPWGFLWTENYITLPGTTTSLSVEVEMLHYIADIPSGSPIGDRFSTMFLPNMTQEQCGQLFHYKQMVATWHTKHGCWGVVQPSWVACGATRSDLTAQFLTYTHSIVDGKACAKEHAKVKSGCVDLQAKPGSSIMKASITSFLPKDDYTEFSAFSIETLVHQGNLNKSYSLMSSEDTYNPAQGIRFQVAYGLIPNVRVWSMGFDFAAGTPRSARMNGWGGLKPWVLHVYDSRAFAKAETMTILMISGDLDCSISSAEAGPVRVWEDPIPLKKVDPPSGNTCFFDPESEVCPFGWKKTTAFELPLESFRVYSNLSNWDGMEVVGTRTCDSLEQFQGPDGMEPFLVTPRMWIEPNIRAVPFFPTDPTLILPYGDECEDTGNFYTGNFCSVHVHHMGMLLRQVEQGFTNGEDMPMLGMVFLLDKDCSVEFLQIREYMTAQNISNWSEFQFQTGQEAAVCSYPTMARAKICGGELETQALQFEIAKFVHHDSVDTEVLVRFRCGWFEDPMVSDVMQNHLLQLLTLVLMEAPVKPSRSSGTLQCRYNTKSNKQRVVKTPGGKAVYQAVKKKAKGPHCGDCGKALIGLPRLRPVEYKRLKKREKRVNRAYGGSRCAHCVRERVIRAFLIEEQKCVKQVLAEKLSQAKEKEGGKKKGKKVRDVLTASLNPEDVRDEKVKVLKQFRAVRREDCVVGQYNGYQDDPDIQKINEKKGAIPKFRALHALGGASTSFSICDEVFCHGALTPTSWSFAADPRPCGSGFALCPQLCYCLGEVGAGYWDIEAKIEEADKAEDNSRKSELARLLVLTRTSAAATAWQMTKELKTEVGTSVAAAISEFVGKEDYNIEDVASKVEEKVTSAVKKLDNVYLTADAAKAAPEGSSPIILSQVVKPVAGQIKEGAKEAALAFTGKEEYKFGDISKEAAARAKVAVASLLGKEEYQFGDVTKAAVNKAMDKIADFTGKDGYKFGDITKTLLRKTLDYLEKDELISTCIVAGILSGEHSERKGAGYRSKCPTFAACVLHLDNERWSNVPIIMKAGKSLERRSTIVRLQFKKAPPQSLFGDQPQNELVIRIQPDEAIYYRTDDRWGAVKDAWGQMTCEEKLSAASMQRHLGETHSYTDFNFRINVHQTSGIRDWHFAVLTCGETEQAALMLRLVATKGALNMFEANTHFDTSSCPVVDVPWLSAAHDEAGFWLMLVGALLLGCSAVLVPVACRHCLKKAQIRQFRETATAGGAEPVIGRPCSQIGGAKIVDGQTTDRVESSCHALM